VPLEFVASSNGNVMLRCSLEEIERLDMAEETDFLPGTVGYEGYDPANVMPLPYFALGADNTSLPVTYDKPVGEVAFRRDVPVHATDGEIGRVHGVVIDPSDHLVTHVLLQEGIYGDVKRSPFPSAPFRTSGPTFDSASRRARCKNYHPLIFTDLTIRRALGLRPTAVAPNNLHEMSRHCIRSKENELT